MSKLRRRVYTKTHSVKAAKLKPGHYASFADPTEANRFYHFLRRSHVARLETLANSVRVWKVK